MELSILLLVSVGLSMDAFAVAICRGLKMKEFKIQNIMIVALFFGFFQGMMPVIGWFLGSQFKKHIEAFDHYVVLMLLVLIGGKMIYESVTHKDACDYACKIEDVPKVDFKELTLLAIATSIDALAVGITFACLNVNIYAASLCIALITFVLSGIGVYLGHRFGAKHKNKAELLGGVVLILIGVKIFLEHLGVIG